MRCFYLQRQVTLLHDLLALSLTVLPPQRDEGVDLLQHRGVWGAIAAHVTLPLHTHGRRLQN